MIIDAKEFRQRVEAAHIKRCHPFTPAELHHMVGAVDRCTELETRALELAESVQESIRINKEAVQFRQNMQEVAQLLRDISSRIQNQLEGIA